MSRETGITFDHSKESVLAACGIDYDREGLAEELTAALETVMALDKSSEIIEFLLENTDDEAVLLVLLRVFQAGMTKTGAENTTP